MIYADDLEEFFNKHPRLYPPKKIYVLPSPLVVPVKLRHLRGIAVAGGAAPKSRITGTSRDTVILTPQSDEESLTHETLHTMGWNELGAYVFGKLSTKLRKWVPPLKARDVEYKKKKVPFSEVEKFGIKPVDTRPETVTLFKKVEK